jgi:hypothetical protein
MTFFSLSLEFESTVFQNNVRACVGLWSTKFKFRRDTAAVNALIKLVMTNITGKAGNGGMSIIAIK